ncbi:cytochrome c3 family protein [Shewanella metallivivens]|uniref:Cytochrome c3 family protein n=1 Tax=Shewanella metallivivens TaxID=2872342 RepID=A0ABT5TKS2_9GAMM|nr:cytochrome c3 family protein [Shewanella metallivivens]MDD8059214.1 cytochrome c3 family protein [Shewanella metallivivens]
MKLTTANLCLLLAVVAFELISFSAMATPIEEDRQYGGGGKGAVTFSSETHARNGFYTCADCHSPIDGEALFEPQRYNFTLQGHNNKEFCWSCHDGKTADRDCKTCHY